MKVALLTSLRLDENTEAKALCETYVQRLITAMPETDIHVLFCGTKSTTQKGLHATWHELPATAHREYGCHTDLNDYLRDSQVLYEGFREYNKTEHFDILNICLNCVGGYIPLMHAAIPIIVSAISHTPGIAAEIQDADTRKWVRIFQQRCLERTDAVILDTEGNTAYKELESTLETKPDMVSTDPRQVFEHLFSTQQTLPRNTERAYQVMMALDTRDAVSNITRDNARLLKELGQPDKIITQYFHEDVKNEIRPIHRLLKEPDCALIFHYWNYNSATWLLRKVHGRKALYYHNITPLSFFREGTKEHLESQLGYAQIKSIVNQFDLLIGDSMYNLQQLVPYLNHPQPALAIHPMLDCCSYASSPYDQQLLHTLTANEDCRHFLFVGRVARNKRQDRLMELFEHYYRNIDTNAHLWIVGNDQQDPTYRQELENLRNLMVSRDHIHFTGKVSDEAMISYLRAADIFLCVSEHEGFCVPLIQAMAFDIPVIAYDAAAVSETMGGAGILIKEWDVPRIAELANLILSNNDLRNSVITGQRQNLTRFCQATTRKKLQAVVDYLCAGHDSPLFTTLGPNTTNTNLESI